MTLEEITQAVTDGKTVYWKQPNYEVKLWADGYNIVCASNNHAIGLTWTDGVTLNGKEKDFFIKEEA
mgnify:CR=1 FL=1